MNTVAYVLRLCCGGAEAAGYQRWEQQLHPIRDAGSARHCRERGTDPLPAHPEVTRAEKGLQLSCPTLALCLSPPSGTAGGSGGGPVLHPEQGTRLAGAGSQTARSREGFYQNSEVGAVTSQSSFLWERKGRQGCVNKPPLPQAAPCEGRGWPRWGSPVWVPPAGVEQIHFPEEFS